MFLQEGDDRIRFSVMAMAVAVARSAVVGSVLPFKRVTEFSDGVPTILSQFKKQELVSITEMQALQFVGFADSESESQVHSK